MKLLRALCVTSATYALLFFTACAQGNTGNAQKPPAGEAKPAAAAPAPAPFPPAAPAPRVNPQRVMRYVREVVAIGPRPVGSPGHRRLQSYLRSQLKADRLEEDAFTAETPAGRSPMRNFIAKYPGTKEGVIVIAGHYDTKHGLKNFVGANDAGSSTGLLLELAHHLRGARREGYSVWLVWLDGEEAFRDFSDTDGLFGSRHLAARWQQDGTASRIKAFLLVDMVGDADLNIEREQYSTSWLVELVYQAATRLGYQSHFYARSSAVIDDHQPFLQAGVPAVDLIDFHYGYDNAHWHTPEDTLDKLSPRSLEIVGNVVLETVRLLDRR